MLSLTLYNCQDEFCLDATTPSLIIRFYDKDTVTNTKSVSLIVWANDKDTLYSGTTTDSLSIPLDTQNTSVTYHLSLIDNSEEEEDADEEIVEDTDTVNQQEDIIINYTTEDVFVSKGCGFKSIFNNVSITTTNSYWIDSYTPTSTFNITDQTEAHVKIYH